MTTEQLASPPQGYTTISSNPFDTLSGALLWYSEVIGYSQDAQVVNQHNLVVRAKRETGWLITTDFYSRLGAFTPSYLKEEMKAAQQKAVGAMENSASTITEATSNWIRESESATALCTLIKAFIEQSIKDGLNAPDLPKLTREQQSLVAQWKTVASLREILAQDLDDEGRERYPGERNEMLHQKTSLIHVSNRLEARMQYHCPVMLMILLRDSGVV